MPDGGSTRGVSNRADLHCEPDEGHRKDFYHHHNAEWGSGDACFVEGFLQKAVSAPEAVFADFEGEPLTFGLIARDSSTLAAYLAEMGICRGDRVAVMMSNSAVQVKVIMALALAGIVWVPINARQRGDGLGYILEHSDPSAIICDDTLLPTVLGTAANLPISKLIVSGGAYEGARSLDLLLTTPASFSAPIPSSNDVFAIMYTSGTTGRPKGVLVSYSMMTFAAEAAARVAHIEDGDVMFLWEPLYHIGGAQVLLLPIMKDVTLAMVERFSASNFWSRVRASGATHVHYLGGILQILLKRTADVSDRDHGVRVFWGGGCADEQWISFERRFGVSIRECYGMTEASSITTGNETGIVGSVGVPMPWFVVEILDTSGSPVSAGEKGEIVVRPLAEGAVFTGYFRDEEATARALRDGLLHTGDMGSFDAEGNLRFYGRMSDSVRIRGENVSAWEVEHVAATHPAVEDCAMVGVDADIGEQDIKLFVQLRAGCQLASGDLADWLAARLAPFQMPRYWALVEKFERTPSERIMKHLLSRATRDEWDCSHSA